LIKVTNHLCDKANIFF